MHFWQLNASKCGRMKVGERKEEKRRGRQLQFWNWHVIHRLRAQAVFPSPLYQLISSPSISPHLHTVLNVDVEILKYVSRPFLTTKWKEKETKTHANWRNGIQVTKKDYAVNILQRSKNALILILTPLILIQLALSPQKVETFIWSFITSYNYGARLNSL